ncbi:hypothetical protein GCM10023066_56480 [Nocardioides kongjuensis]
MQDSQREGEVGAGDGLEEEVGALARRGEARVDDDEPAAVLAQAVEVACGGRHGLFRRSPPRARFDPRGRNVRCSTSASGKGKAAVDAEGLVAGAGGHELMHHRPCVVDLAVPRATRANFPSW